MSRFDPEDPVTDRLICGALLLAGVAIALIVLPGIIALLTPACPGIADGR